MQRKSDSFSSVATAPGIPGSRRVMMRVVNDVRYGVVAVYEEDPAIPGASKVLTFDSQETTVRIKSFPKNWATLSVTALLGLVLVHSA